MSEFFAQNALLFAGEAAIEIGDEPHEFGAVPALTADVRPVDGGRQLNGRDVRHQRDHADREQRDR